jgi:hypothetical protein
VRQPEIEVMRQGFLTLPNSSGSFAKLTAIRVNAARSGVSSFAVIALFLKE